MAVYEPMRDEDIDTVYELYRKTVLRFEDPTVADLKEILQGLKQSIRGRRERMQRVVIDEISCAYVCMLPLADGTVLLEDLLVLPQYRRRGVGTYVLDDCKAKADGMLYRYVYIGNHAETAFYEKNGFTVSSLASPTREVLAWNPYRKKRR